MRYLGFILALVFVSGCLNDYGKTSPTSDNAISTSSTTSTSTSTVKESPSLDEELYKCWKKLPSSSDHCFEELAIRLNNSEICRKIPNPDEADKWCYYVIAKSLKNSSICGEINNLIVRDDCYYDIALSLGEYGICKKIKTVRQSDNCYIEIAVSMNNSILCRRTSSNESVDECYARIGVKYNETGLCGEIQDLYWRDWCYLSNDINPSLGGDCDDQCWAHKYYEKGFFVAGFGIREEDYAKASLFLDTSIRLYGRAGNETGAREVEEFKKKLDKRPRRECGWNTLTYPRRLYEEAVNLYREVYVVAAYDEVRYDEALDYIRHGKRVAEECYSPEDTEKYLKKVACLEGRIIKDMELKTYPKNISAVFNECPWR